MDERRSEQRLKDVNEITISVISGEENHPDEKSFYTYTRDISVHGARIRTTIILPVDTYLEVDLTLKDLQQKITAIGKVKWIKIVIEDLYYEAGVEFVNTPGEAVRKIEDYIFWKQKSIDPAKPPV